MGTDQRRLFKEVSQCVESGESLRALALLREAIRRGELDSDGVDKAGRRCQTLFETAGVSTTSIALLGQCTTNWLAAAITAVAWGDGRALRVTEGQYDNVVQELLRPQPDTPTPSLVVLLPWNQRLLADDKRSPTERVADEVSFWQRVWRLIEEGSGARIVQLGYDWVTPGAMGLSLGMKANGPVQLVRAVNDRLRETLPPGNVFLDLEQVSGEMGRERFYDFRRYLWTKQPFSEEGIVRLGEHVAAAARAVINGPKKVLVLDLDNTLWGGVVGEVGADGVTIGEGPDGEAFAAFQRHIKKLSQRGVVLTVCSKNNDADAREPFEKNSRMVLALDDFAQFEATWDAKSLAIRRIASTLQLGIDSFVFVDDNPAEREQVRQAFPEIAVVDLPSDPAGYIAALERGLWFEAVDLTQEDRSRVEQYRVERRRRDAEVGFESLDDYLSSLQMIADLRPIDAVDLDRVVQLIGKTNQFNLTTRRHSPMTLRQMLDAPGTIGLTLRVEDRFGDHGLIAVLIAVADTTHADMLQVDTWLMSCRVINRTVEDFLFNALVDAASQAGVRRLRGLYVPTPKNGLVKDLYLRLGFVPCPARDPATVEYELDLESVQKAKTFVHRRQVESALHD